ncbi:hypothetical protein F5Y11DRAFT_334627 [Daldinia sp. FL1419]|nr:hypothetical protein F5Y11DRAFT_334627 [Daldinia sp. FL1419]
MGIGIAHYNNPGGLIAGSVILAVASTFVVGLRFHAKKWRGHPILISDWLILAALVFGIALAVLEIYGVAIHALGYPLGHSAETSASDAERRENAKWIESTCLILGAAGAGLVKLSVCFFYWHLFAKAKFRRFLILWITIILLWTICFVIGLIFKCGSHVEAQFLQGGAREYCGRSHSLSYGMVGSDIATDFITLVIPIPLICRLQISTQKKLLALLTFMIGTLSVCASILKAYIYIIATLSRGHEDRILILTAVSIWNLVEVNVGIVAASGPTIRIALARILPTEAVLTLVSSIRSIKSKSSSKAPSSIDNTQNEEGLEIWKVNDISISRTPGKMANLESYGIPATATNKTETSL